MQDTSLLTSVPELPQTRELTLDDRELVEGLLAVDRPDISELTFTNLFIWRHAYELRLARVDDTLCIFSWRADPEDSFLLPPLPLSGGDATVLDRALRYLADNGRDAKLCRISAAQIEKLGLTADRFDIQPDRNDWDYVYAVRDLIELAGEKYHGKRNHIAQFTTQHEFEYRPLTPDLVPGCEAVQDLWCDEKHCDLSASLRADARAVKEALRNRERLSAVGACILIGGKVEAFTLGEPLNDDTITIHLEKANAAFHGLYQVVNQQFLEHEWQSYAYVNRQQDLGIEGLRKAKLSYYPHHMIEKHVVRARG